ncbi:hypothetical protein M0R04_05195 [Candidatus Dojkabacteria bacterium]|jgi:hypothetical protein|nr:hypothetical protein [Candidatus Dojkabacteria bacterium]
MFWRKNTKKIKDGIDYRLHPYNEDINAIELLIEPYEHVLYHYGMVRFEYNLNTPVLKFNYSIISTGCYTLVELQDDINFKKLIGDILTHILITEKVYDDKNRTDDTEEFDI